MQCKINLYSNHGFHYLPLLEFCYLLQFLQQEECQLVFIAHQSLFDTFQGRLEMSNDFLKKVVTDPFTQAETHNTCQFCKCHSIPDIIFLVSSSRHIY